jgi:hypothetical protein
MQGWGNRRTTILALAGAAAVAVGMLVYSAFVLLAAPAPDPVGAAATRTVASNPDTPVPPSLTPPSTALPSGPAGPPTGGPSPSGDGPPWPSGEPGTTPGAPADLHADAPSDNLRRLATALRVKHKSTTGVMTVAAGLNLTAPVEISVLWDEVGPRPTRTTQDYNNATGNRALFLFPPGDGRPRRVAVVITLAERLPDGTSATYAVRTNVTITPLYDITVSPLRFTLEDDCDLVGESEVWLIWLRPNGSVGEFRRGMIEGQFVSIAGFGATYREVGVSAGLEEPPLRFYEDDVDGGTSFHGPPGRNGRGLLPGGNRAVDRFTYAINDVQCGARYQYDITFQHREYLFLE